MRMRRYFALEPSTVIRLTHQSALLKIRKSISRAIIFSFPLCLHKSPYHLNHNQNRFPRPTCVFLDGDSAESQGCVLLPGGDAPEQVVFKELQAHGWYNVWSRIGRDSSSVHDACNRAMTLSDHHNWVKLAASELKCGGETLWQAMCAEWVAHCLCAEDAKKIIYPIEDILA